MNRGSFTETSLIRVLQALSPSDAIEVLKAYVAAVGVEAMTEETVSRILQASGLPENGSGVESIPSILFAAYARSGSLDKLQTSIRDHINRKRAIGEVFEAVKYLHTASPEGFGKLVVATSEISAKSAAEICGAVDVDGALLSAFVQEMGADRKEAFLAAYTDILWDRHPQAAVDFAKHFSPSELNRDATIRILAKLLASGSSGDWLESLPAGDRVKLLDDCIQDSSARNPLHGTTGAPRAWLSERLRLPDPQSDSVLTALRPLIDLPLEELLSIAQMCPTPVKDDVIKWVYANSRDVLVMMRADSQGTINRISAIGEPLRSDVIASALSWYATEEPESALKLARHLSSDSEIAALVCNIIVPESIGLPVACKSKLLIDALSNTNSPNDFAEGVTALMSECGRVDPRQGLQVFDALEQKELREIGARVLAQSWAETDPLAASEWIVSMPAGRERDIAARELVSKSIDNPEAALGNAYAIGDQSLRIQAAKEVVDRWGGSASHWMEAAMRAAGFSSKEIGMITHD